MTTNQYIEALHTEAGEPTTTISSYRRDEQGNLGHFAGLSPAGAKMFAYEIERSGHAVTGASYEQPSAHRVSGCGLMHDDATFAETGGREGSMAAYYENGEAFDGRRWWNDKFAVGYYTGRHH